MHNADHASKTTRAAVIWTGVLSEPLMTVYTLLPFVLRKELGATTEQLAILMMLKPVVSIISLYWSYAINERRDKLLSNVVWAGILSRLPFLLFPFLTNIWAFIGCAAFHTMMVRGGVPAWLEILKLNLASRERGKVFSLGASIGYLEGVVLAIAFGVILDNESQIWRWLFPISSAIGIIGVLLQSRIPIKLEKIPMRYQVKGGSFWQKILDPWKSAWSLMEKRPDFYRFQLGFMICGFGLMLIQPVLPVLFVDILNLSYSEMLIVLSICRGIGYASTASFWARLINKMNIYKFTSVIFFVVSAYGGLLILAPVNIFFLYVAFFIYGIALAGNHLSWNLSGPIFATREDSSLYTSVNVATVGLRGCIAPYLGGTLCLMIGPVAVIGIGMILCAFAGVKMYSWSKPSIVSQEHIA
ncbi:MAG: putative MFS family arabinose efflux permease [Chlamydiales bacterium]